MKRLMAAIIKIDADGFEGGFVAPTGINTWVERLGSIQPIAALEDRLPPRHRRNIGYRLQLMEFECALLLLNIEAVRIGKPSTLHSTVSAMKTHQFIGLAYSVLEGIGGHLTRAGRRAAGHEINERAIVPRGEWHLAIIGHLVLTVPELAEQHQQLQNMLDDLKGSRDRVHLDRVDPEEEDLHFEQFYGEETFLRAYRAFRTLMGGLCPRWPETCLNEPW